MPHQLAFQRPYKSIVHINGIDLPDIAIITGANGSGKSHLLQAISLGCVSTSATTDFRREVSRFDWNTIVPNDNGSYSIATRTAKIEEAIARFKDARNNVLLTIISNIERSPHLDQNLVNDLFDLEAASDPHQLKYYTNDSQKTTANQVRSWLPQYGQNFVNIAGSNDIEIKSKLRELWAENHSLLMFGKSDEIRKKLIITDESTVNIFAQQFAKIFVIYMQRWQENYLSRSEDKNSLSDEEFIEVNRIPPWDFVNQILKESRLPFRINSPSRTNFVEPFEPRLTRIASGIEMHFNDLSSGEKVLMSFALCVYNVTGGHRVTFPKVLLLDEVDAPLHPEMVGVMLRVIQNILVDTHQIKVILTTHKPTTVALAPEGSIFQMLPEGPILDKISREKAVSLLTVGVPTMAFTTDLRLQVFTEANVDATAFGRMYQLYKSQLSGRRSIEFIESGRRTPSGDADSGRARVKDLVTKLRASGAVTILGLVDWDGKTENVEWVHELCGGKRHSIENLFLDPVIRKPAVRAVCSD